MLFLDAIEPATLELQIPFDWDEAKDRIRAAVRKLAM